MKVYQPGEYVVYAENGLCLVEQVGVPDFAAGNTQTRYYFLRASDDGSRIYVPTDTHMPLRAPLTAQEAEELLQRLGDLPVRLPERRDRKTVLAHYQELLRPHTAESLAQTVKSIRYQHRGRPGRMSGAEETLLKRSERHLCGELAGALSISAEDARVRMEAALVHGAE